MILPISCIYTQLVNAYHMYEILTVWKNNWPWDKQTKLWYSSSLKYHVTEMYEYVILTCQFLILVLYVLAIPLNAKQTCHVNLWTFRKSDYHSCHDDIFKLYFTTRKILSPPPPQISSKGQFKLFLIWLAQKTWLS